jgi:hypothetical protein
MQELPKHPHTQLRSLSFKFSLQRSLGTRCSIRQVDNMHYAYRFYVRFTCGYEEENRDSSRKVFSTDGLVRQPICPLCRRN